MRGRVRGRVGQEQALVVVVGEAGVVAGAAAARLHSGHGGLHHAHLLGLTQFLDEETFVTALLVGRQVKTRRWGVSEGSETSRDEMTDETRLSGRVFVSVQM